jgi:hypothetical protein
MGLEVLTAMKMPLTSGLKPEDGGDTFSRNVGNHPQDYTASQPRRPQSTYILGGTNFSLFSFTGVHFMTCKQLVVLGRVWLTGSLL